MIVPAPERWIAPVTSESTYLIIRAAQNHKQNGQGVVTIYILGEYMAKRVVQSVHLVNGS